MTFIQSTILLKVFLKELGAIRKSYLIINSVRRMKSTTCLHLKSPLRKRDVERAKFKNLFMLSVRISSSGCTREVWRARKLRKSSSRHSREQLQLFECIAAQQNLYGASTRAMLQLTIGSYVSVRSSRYEARGKFESTKDA